MKIFITIPGEPCSQGRPRFSTVNGHAVAYDPEKSKNYKATARYIASYEMQEQGWTYSEKAVNMEVRAYMGIPQSKPKKFKIAALAQQIRPTKKPDLDNIVKIIKDSFSKLLYKDDAQIVFLNAEKFYSDIPRVEVMLEERE